MAEYEVKPTAEVKPPACTIPAAAAPAQRQLYLYYSDIAITILLMCSLRAVTGCAGTSGASTRA